MDPRITALEYLRERARIAHLDGNGILVNHLAAIALDTLRKPAAAGHGHLPASAWAWAVIFSLYWLIDAYTLREVEKVLEAATGTTDSDRELIEFLRSYDFLIREPIVQRYESQRAGFLSAKLEWAKDESAIECEVAIVHLAELLWFRGPQEPHFSAIVDVWIPRLPMALGRQVSALRRRLKVQTSLVVLGSPRLDDISIDTEWDSYPWVPHLWSCTFDGDYAGIDQILAEQSPRHSSNAPISRLIFDARHFNRFHGEFGDSQTVGLTRRRLMTTLSGELVFEDVRQARASGVVAGLHLGAANASDRQIGLVLGMLLELAALRRWDLGAWRKAAEIQSRMYAEIGQHHEHGPFFSSLAIRAAVSSFHLDAKDRWVVPALSQLEYLPKGELEVFIGNLLSARPAQYHEVKKVLANLGDAIPEPFYTRLAEWSVRYVERTTKEKFGGSIDKIEFLSALLPEIPPEHGAWLVLAPVIQSLFQEPNCWAAGRRSLFIRILLHAPETIAVKALESMIAAASDAAESQSRWSIVCSVLEDRPQLSTDKAMAIISIAPSQEDTIRLVDQAWAAPFIHFDNDAARLRAYVHFRSVLKKAVPSEDTKQFELSASGWEAVEQIRWSDTDVDLLDELLAATENPRVLRGHIGRILGYIHCMVQKGPDEFAKRVAVRLPGWLRSPHLGWDPFGESNGPFSAIRISSNSTEDVIRSLAFLAGAVRKRASSRFDSELSRFLTQLTSQPPKGVTCPAILLALELAAEDEQRRGEMLTVCQALLLAAQLRAEHDSSAAEELMDGLQAPTWFSSSRRTKPVSTEVVRELAEKIEALLLAVALSSTPRVRGQVAAYLVTLESRDALTERLGEVLVKLRSDPRASVRRHAR